MKSAKNNYSTNYKYIQVPNKANLGIDLGAICMLFADGKALSGESGCAPAPKHLNVLSLSGEEKQLPPKRVTLGENDVNR